MAVKDEAGDIVEGVLLLDGVSCLEGVNPVGVVARNLDPEVLWGAPVGISSNASVQHSEILIKISDEFLTTNFLKCDSLKLSFLSLDVVTER